MTLGTSIRAQVVKLISDTNIRSTLTLHPIKRYAGERGGYDTPTDVEAPTRSVYAIPSKHIKALSNYERFGDLQTGEIRFLIKYDEVVDTDDAVEFNSENYTIKEITDIPFNDVIVAQAIILTKIQ